ncbi:neprilysin-1-like [Haematobia irritans]|uniref:neprilysin-1-like n=1 Tax=Haematobia irritans TaxID=7368 RepID=UPI003F4FBD44
MKSKLYFCYFTAFVSISIANGLNQTSYKSMYNIDPLTDAMEVRKIKTQIISKYFNDNMDPCEDFYEFTCGKYYRENATNEFNKMQMASLKRIRNELETDDSMATKDEIKVKKFFKSCMNSRDQLLKDTEKLKDFVKELGPIPILMGDMWKENSNDWRTLHSQIFHKTVKGGLFDFNVISNFNGSSINYVSLTQPSKWMFNPFNLLEKENLITNIFEKYFQINSSLAKEASRNIVALEEDLTKAQYVSKSDYALETIEDLQTKYLALWDTQKLITQALGFTPKYMVVQHEYLGKVFEVLQNHTPENLLNYIFLCYINNYIFHPDETSNMIENKCLEIIETYFYDTLANLIYRKYPEGQHKDNIMFIWDNLKEAFEAVYNMPQMSWMPNETRQLALDKLKAMELEIMGVDNVKKNDFLNLDLNVNNYLYNINAFFNMESENVRSQIKEACMISRKTKSNAPHYSYEENIVRLPVSYLEPFFILSPSYPNFYNFANLGFILGQEMTHAFDTIGRKYDNQKNFKDWWDPKFTRYFYNISDCLMAQYKAFNSSGQSLPFGEDVANENLADNVAVYVAFGAYMQWYNKTKEHGLEVFPTKTYNNRQWFFIAFGQMLCANMKADYIPPKVIPHVPEKFRVNSCVTNFPAFWNTFNCPKGSGMHPMNLCKL